MRYELLDKPDFGTLHVRFDQAGEQLLVESSAMVARDVGVEMRTAMTGGVLNAARRKLLGGESIFQNTFTATAPGQTLWVAPATEGDVEELALDGTTPLHLSSGAFLASAPTVRLDTRWSGAKGFFSGTGFFLLRAEGTGPIFFGSYGGIHAIDVGPAGYIVDTTHVVGFTGGLDYRVARVGGVRGLFFSGEGLVCEFRGRGRLWVATRNASSLAGFLHPFRILQRQS